MSGSGAFYRWEGNDLVLAVRVQPRASRDGIVGPAAGSLKVRITAPPIEGRANAHLVKFLAEVFGIPHSAITLMSGHGGRDKRLRIHSPRTLPPDIRRPSIEGAHALAGAGDVGYSERHRK